MAFKRSAVCFGEFAQKSTWAVWGRIMITFSQNIGYFIKSGMHSVFFVINSCQRGYSLKNRKER